MLVYCIIIRLDIASAFDRFFGGGVKDLEELSAYLQRLCCILGFIGERGAHDRTIEVPGLSSLESWVESLHIKYLSARAFFFNLTCT